MILINIGLVKRSFRLVLWIVGMNLENVSIIQRQSDWGEYILGKCHPFLNAFEIWIICVQWQSFMAPDGDVVKRGNFLRDMDLWPFRFVLVLVLVVLSFLFWL